MFEGWENFYLITGGSAGALIGLMFVVVTLTAGRDRDEVERGKHLYTSPIVWHLAVILALSAGAMAPTMPAIAFGWLAAGLALIGATMGVRSTIGIARRPGAPKSPLFDLFWYGIAPAIAYVGLGAAALTVLTGRPWANSAIGADLLALLMISIHAEWDLVTYLAPIAKPEGGQDR
ncbi:MAG: hypothetical protein ABIO80_09255 [Sphingomicrobium sp.]